MGKFRQTINDIPSTTFKVVKSLQVRNRIRFLAGMLFLSEAS